MSPRRLLLALFLAMPLLAHGQSKPIRVAYEEWPPYMAEKMPGHGFACEIMDQALTRMGYTPTWIATTSEDAEKGLAEGRFDLHPCFWKTPQREKYLVYSEPYFTSQLVIISTKRSLTPPNRLADLKGKKVGLAKGYGYGEAITGNKDFLPVYGAHIGENMGKLFRGEVDALIGDRFVAQFISISQVDSSPDALNFSVPLEEKPLHVVVSRKFTGAEALIGSLNTTLGGMRTDGTLPAILKKHGMRR